MNRFAQKFAVLALTLGGALAVTPRALAGTPLGYGGRLVDPEGQPLAGPVDLELRFFRSADGHDQVGPVLTFPATKLASGVFQLTLALTSADAAAVFGDGSATVFVEARAQGKTYPRQRFLAVPYALRVPVDGTSIGYNASGELTFTGSTGVTTVTAAAPLTVGGSATARALSLPAASAAQSGYLTSADWTTFNGKQAALGYTPLNKAGDTLGGPLDAGAHAVTNLPSPTQAGDAVTKAYADGKLGGFPLDQAAKLDDYVVKWDATAGKFYFAADQVGAAGGGIVSVNGLNVSNQTLAVGTAGTAPAWTSSGSQHTLDLPLASAAGVTAGLLSKADYDAFTAKQAALTATSTLAVGTVTSALQDGLELKPYGGAAGQTGELRFDALSGPNYVALKAPDTVSASKVWTLPSADGTSGQVITTDGAGHLSWSSHPTAPVTSVNGQTGAVSLTTANVAEGTSLYYTDARARAALVVSAPLSYNAATGTLALGQASGVGNGYLTAADYLTFNGKQDALTAMSNVTTGQLNFGANGHTVGLKAPAGLGANSVYTLPAGDGSAGEVLKTDGSGNLAWIPIPSAPVSSVAGRTGAVTLSTTDVSEGTSLYYTDARARAALSATAPLGYNASTGVLSVTGTLAVASGGTGASTAAANTVFAAPDGTGGAPSFRTLTANDVPSVTSAKISNFAVAVAAAETDPKVGANTTNYLSKWNGSALVAGSVVDDASGNVGIGTTSAANRLQLGSVGATGYAGNDLVIGNGTQVTAIDTTANGSLFYTNKNFAFMPSGTGSVGNVGIGTTSAGQKLTVAGTVESTSGGYKFPDGTTQATAAYGPSGIPSSRRLIVKNNATTPNTKVDLTAAEILLRSSTGGTYYAANVAVTADLAASGLNGLDTGTKAINSWYYLWLISNGSSVAGLFSLSSATPTLPGGYTFTALVSSVRTDASGNLYVFRQAKGKVTYSDNQRVVSNGSATAMTSVSLASFVPPIALTVDFMIYCVPNAGSSTSPHIICRLSNDGSGADAVAYGGDYTPGSYVYYYRQGLVVTDESIATPQTVWYYNNSSIADMTIDVRGYTIE